MARDPRMTVRRRPDGLVQIHALPAPFTLGAMRRLGLGVLGAALLVASLIAAPFWIARTARAGSTARDGERSGQGASVTDLTAFRR